MSTIGSSRESSHGTNNTNDKNETVAKVMMKLDANHSSRSPLSSTISRQPSARAMKTNPIQSTLRPRAKRLLPLPFEHLRLVHHPLHERQRDQSDRPVDQENPVPGQIVRQPATQCRSYRGCHYYRNAIECERLHTQPGGERICKHGLLGRRHSATTQPLQDAKNNERREGRCRCAKKRRYCEEGNAGHIITLAANDP